MSTVYASASEFKTRTLRDYLRILFRRWAVIAISVAAVSVTVAIGLLSQTRYYAAEVKMLISAKKPVEATYYRDLGGGEMQEKMTVTQSEIVKSAPVLQRTIAALDLFNRPFNYEKDFASPFKKFLLSLQKEKKLPANLTPQEERSIRFRIAFEDLKQRVAVQPVRDTNTFIIRVQDFSPVAAARTANTISRSYVIFDLEQQLSEVLLKYGGEHPTVMQLRDNINKMIKTLHGDTISNQDAIGPASVKIIEQASMPLKPDGISKKFLFLIAVLISLVFGVILVFIFEYMDPTLKSPQEVEEILNLPLLGTLPKSKQPAESFIQDFADHIQALIKGKGYRVFTIASVTESAGFPSLLESAARYLSQKPGQRILVIDANPHHPALNGYLKNSKEPGLAEVLENKASAKQAVKTVTERFSVLPAGRASLNPASWDVEKIKELLDALRQEYAAVLILPAALLRFRESAIFAELSDAVILRIEEQKTRREIARAALTLLEKKNARVAGTLLNERTFPIPAPLYNWV